MNRKRLFSKLGFGIVLVSIIFFFGSGLVNAGDCRIIRITSLAKWQETSIGVEPEIMRITTGTCIIWYNRSTSKIKITFEDGKTCTDITDASVGFKLDEKRGCYFTETYIEPGGTASLQFNGKGNVEYIVEAEGRTEKPKGHIKIAD